MYRPYVFPRVASIARSEPGLLALHDCLVIPIIVVIVFIVWVQHRHHVVHWRRRLHLTPLPGAHFWVAELECIIQECLLQHCESDT